MFKKELKLNVFIRQIVVKYNIQSNDVSLLNDLIANEHIFLIDKIKNLENQNDKSKYKIKNLIEQLHQSEEELKNQKSKYSYMSDKLKNLNFKLKTQENSINDLREDIQVRKNYSETIKLW